MANKQIYQLTETLSVSPDDWLAIDLDSSNLTRKARVGNVFSVSEGSSYTGGTANGIMFNDGDTFTTDGGFKFDSTTNILTVGESGNHGQIELMRSSGGTRMGYLGAQNSGLWIGLDYNFGKSHIWFDNATKTVTIGNGGTSLGAALGVANTTDIVAQRIDLSNGQTADEFQINSYGNTGGDLFKVDADGNTSIVSNSGYSASLVVGGNGNGYVLRVNDNCSNLGGGALMVSGTGTSTNNLFLFTDANRAIRSYQADNGRFGITDNATAFVSNSALLELNTTTRGFLPPRLTTTQRDAIASPATGLSIFNTTTAQPEYYSGTAWEGAAGGGISIGDSIGGASVNQVLFADASGLLAQNSKFVFNGSTLNFTGGSSSDQSNSSYGVGAGNSNFGSSNTSIGNSANGNSNGTSMTSIGRSAGQNAISNESAFIGYEAGYASNGNRSVFAGYRAGRGSTGGGVGIGDYALYIGNGINNAALGANSQNSSTGTQNTSVGTNSLFLNTANYSTVVGFQAGQSNTGNYVLALGYQAGLSNTQANRFIVGQQNLPQFAGAAAAAAALPAAGANGVYLYWDTTDNTIKARP